MKFCWSTLNVKNMEESLRFYQDILGLSITGRFVTERGVEIVFLGEGETKIELICHHGDNEVNVGKDISWGFEVKSLTETLAGFQKKGIPVEEGPFQPHPHIRFFFIKDPNGLRIQLVENQPDA